MIRAINPSKICSYLKSIPRWIHWTPSRRGDKIIKLPCDKNKFPINSQQAASWCQFETVYEYHAAHPHAFGLGFVFNDAGFKADSNNDNDNDNILIALDFDNVRDWHPDAREFINRFVDAEAYVERSPSTFGYHVIATVNAPTVRGHKTRVLIPGTDHSFEVYTKGKYFTVTSDRARGSSRVDITDLIAPIIAPNVTAFQNLPTLPA